VLYVLCAPAKQQASKQQPIVLPPPSRSKAFIHTQYYMHSVL